MAAALAVALGGAVGALLRYYAGLWLNGGALPWGTLAVNLVGSFAIGFVVLWSVRREWPDPAYLLCVTGVLGGFTTFSAFSFESLELLQAGKLGLAAGYSLGSVVLGLLLAWLGFALAQRIAG
jgi:CrcB protein